MDNSTPHATAAHVPDAALTAGDNDYHKGLSSRQMQMIAIGGAIGTGLFMGAGGRLEAAGPGIVISYAVCGFFAFLILRALGELVMHRPSTGSFVSYAREFYGEKAAFATGWLYWLNWVMTAIVDITAVALYMGFFGKYVGWISSVPQWLWALAALAVVAFLVVGCYFVIFGTPLDGHEVGFSLLADNGGLLPNGLLPVLVLMQGVVFSYASIELIGTAAGETANPEKVMPKAINTVIIRIAVFYVGSLVLLSLLLPYSAYSAGESPFVTFFGSIGVQGMDVVMNLVVLTAALSSLNAGLYSTGRIMRSMSLNGSAPKFAGRMNKAGVPYGGIVITAVVAVLGVVLNAVVPAKAFEIVLNFAAIGIIASWAMIVLCQMALVKSAKRGEQDRPSFRMPFAPVSGWVTLGFLALVLVMMAFDNPVGTWTIASLAIIIPLIIGGWYLCRGRINEIAEARLRNEQPAIQG
ncbi:amino acid permease [Glutamicibacter sp. FR1]|uniref:amino acid permease n=1 Tax=Glutamicibacter sp. FR1 TaxID=3393744 RepID=UPI0039AF9EB6